MTVTEVGGDKSWLGDQNSGECAAHISATSQSFASYGGVIAGCTTAGSKAGSSMSTTYHKYQFV